LASAHYMASDILTHFGCLDELVQVVYQGFSRFVVLSKVDDQSWTIHLGLQGPEGRWWKGRWTAEDILHVAGSKSSAKFLETFADKLAETLVRGELYVENWSPEAGAEIQLTLGPSSKRPLHIPLVEMKTVDAASYATSVFLDIALQAQSRKCHLNSAPYVSAPISPPPLAHATLAAGSKSAAAKATTSASVVDTKAQEEIKALTAELLEQKRRKSSVEPTEKPTAPRPPKGASLANPNKKARKYQALEFESDDE